MSGSSQNSELSRRDFLKKLWFWAVVGVSSWHILETFAKDPQERKIDVIMDNSLPSHDPKYVSRIEKKMSKSINDYHYIFKKYAGSDVDTYTNQSKIDYVMAKAKKSNLPDYLKDTIPFVPFQESWYKLTAKSWVWAKWPWQFMESTAAKYNLIEWVWKNKKDYRSDMKKSTNAAIAYFGNLYKLLKSDPHYKSLEKKYWLQEDDLLLPATINAYNSWPGHMQRAFKVMDTEASVRRDVDKAATYKRWLFVYLTTQYIYDFKKYQDWPPFYFEESADYVYCIEAYKYLHMKWAFDTIKSSQSAVILEDEKSLPDIKQASFASSYHAVLWAASSWLTYLLGRKLIKWSSKLSRREFFSASTVAVWWAIGGAIYGGAVNLDMEDLHKKIDTLLWKWALEKFSYDDVLSEERNALFMEIYYKAIVVARDWWNSRAAETLSKRSLQDVMDITYYPWFQYLWDAAFYLYKEKSEDSYLQMAQYFYNRAWTIAEEQKNGKYKKPQQWTTKLEERLMYCKRALDMIDVEFAK